MANYLYLLLIVACPLMMVFMMRGMHGGFTSSTSTPSGRPSVGELRRFRERIDGEIADRSSEGEERDEHEPGTQSLT